MDHRSEKSDGIILKIVKVLDSRKRFELLLLFVLMLCSGIAELLSLGAFIPFLSVLTDSDQAWKSEYGQTMARVFSLDNSGQLILPSVVIFASSSLIVGILRLSTLWGNSKFSASIGCYLSHKAFANILHQPYTAHLDLKSSDVISILTSSIGRSVSAINSLLQLLSSAIIALGLLSGIILVNPGISLPIICIFAILYVVIARMSQNKLQNNSKIITESLRRQLKIVQESLGSIRDLILDRSQYYYIGNYNRYDEIQRNLQANNQFIGVFPRYTLESLAMVALSLLGYYLTQKSNAVNAIPTIGTISLGLQRILPALQQVYGSWATIKSYNADLWAVFELFDIHTSGKVVTAEPCSFRNKVELRDVSFSYARNQSLVIKNIQLTIGHGERIGIVGPTGSGKSTVTDIIMGLLKPDQGDVVVDNCPIYSGNQPERLLAWQQLIAHVPQTIYLADSTISENIAFGVPRSAIDVERVYECAQKAQIFSYIESTPDKFNTLVGERGIKLSGGQRQRIGIARALYKRAQVLILDEATSALDTNTESAVMDTVFSLDRNLTIIVVAHRITTLERCDKIVKVDEGELSTHGSFIMSNDSGRVI